MQAVGDFRGSLTALSCTSSHLCLNIRVDNVNKFSRTQLYSYIIFSIATLLVGLNCIATCLGFSFIIFCEKARKCFQLAEIFGVYYCLYLKPVEHGVHE